MRWEWLLTSRAEKSLARLDKPVRARILDALDRLAEELTAGAALSNVKRLINVEPEEWRLRVGDYRLRFQLEIREAEAGAVIVVKVAHRSDAYRA